nr:hypothetical protein [Tanacetum cinerariifolium]
MKAYPKQIDWGKVIATNEIMNGDEEEEAKVKKTKKFLAMLESEKARVKDYTKLVVTDGMLTMKDDKGKGKLVEDNRKGKEAEHHHLKVNKDDKGKRKLVEDNGKGKVHNIQNRVGSVEVDLARAIKVKQVDDHDLDTLDLENRIKNLEQDFEEKKAKEEELKAKKGKEAMLAELKAKKAKNAKEAMLAEVV